MQLTQRQALILKAVVEEHHRSGRPVGSRTLVESGIVDAAASTVRYELGRLEELGLLEHPHTSAGRVPTDVGYRIYVDHLMDIADPAQRRAGAAAPIVPRDPGTRLDEALRATTQQLADVTGMLAVVTAPRASGAIIRHVEVLQAQPALLVVVVISAAGDVVRHAIPTELPIDSGLVDWAAEYLNEQVSGMALGQNALRQRLEHPDLDRAERAILRLLAPAFIELADETQEVHVGGPAVLGGDVQRVVQLVAMLDERRRLLEALRPIVEGGVPALRALASRRVEVRIGAENDLPELQQLSVVGAPYGAGVRPLGMVGLIGPRAMDYTLATSVVHLAADGLSAAAEELYQR